MCLFYRTFITLLFVVVFYAFSYAQCCSANPIVGSTNIGILTKGTIREIFYYRYIYADTYFERDTKMSDIQYLQYSLYSYAGNILSYGLLRKLTIDLELGYYLKKSELTASSRLLSTQGWNNGVLLLKYGLFKLNNLECNIGAGLKFPFSRNPIEKDGNPLSVSLQTSTNAFGGVFLFFLQKYFPTQQLRIFLIHRAETFNGYDAIYYMKGNAFITNIFLSRSFGTHWMTILQIRNEIRTRDYYYDMPQMGTGSILCVVSPQINYHIKGFNISVLYEFPIYRYVNEIQITSKYAFSFILTKDFNLSSQ